MFAVSQAAAQHCCDDGPYGFYYLYGGSNPINVSGNGSGVHSASASDGSTATVNAAFGDGVNTPNIQVTATATAAAHSLYGIEARGAATFYIRLFTNDATVDAMLHDMVENNGNFGTVGGTYDLSGDDNQSAKIQTNSGQNQFFSPTCSPIQGQMTPQACGSHSWDLALGFDSFTCGLNHTTCTPAATYNYDTNVTIIAQADAGAYGGADSRTATASIDPVFSFSSAIQSLIDSHQLGVQLSQGFVNSAPQSSPPSSPVPEVATWAMLLIGFGIVGGTVRRRKPATASLS